MYANNLKWTGYGFGRYSFTSAILITAMLQFLNSSVNASHGALVSPTSSSVPVNISLGDDLVYSLRCWQEGKEIISETNFAWSGQSMRIPAGQWLTFTSADGRKSQLTITPIGTAVCQIHGRSGGH